MKRGTERTGIPSRGATEILFVCTGNTCRSPLAEVAAREFLDRLHVPVQVSSAGTAGVPGAGASMHAQQVAAEAGLDLSAHRVRLLQPEMLERASLVLVMGEAHRRLVHDMVPEAPVHLLAEFAGDRDREVADPFGGSLDEYRRTFARIRTLVEASMRRFQGGLGSEKIEAPPPGKSP